ncbi:hypothetical protein M9H77_01936 [Catharanthus roseus]|uniref:Uncharacterized protein n=1 Tax=Catharanthus roseus TaxID=4058 RepID=A0ACC0C739_CATRO|nr:hypothetical protein M9H77_01936 [Catharanthus roseus]
MQGRNMVEEVLYLSAKRGYTVFYRNCEESNVLSNIIIAHPTSIAMIRMWPYVLIMDTTYKMNKESGLMPVIEGVFSKSYNTLSRRYINQNVLAKLTEMVKNEEVAARNWISHWALKKIWDEIKGARELSDDAQNKCGHYLRKSHGLPCACELLSRYEHWILLQLEDVYVFWRTLEIGVDVPSSHAWDMESEMRDLTTMLDEISTGPISKVRECRRLMKGILCPVLPEDPCALLTSPPEHAVTKGRQKTNSTKRDKSY